MIFGVEFGSFVLWFLLSIPLFLCRVMLKGFDVSAYRRIDRRVRPLPLIAADVGIAAGFLVVFTVINVMVVSKKSPLFIQLLFLLNAATHRAYAFLTAIIEKRTVCGDGSGRVDPSVIRRQANADAVIGLCFDIVFVAIEIWFFGNEFSHHFFEPTNGREILLLYAFLIELASAAAIKFFQSRRVKPDET